MRCGGVATTGSLAVAWPAWRAGGRAAVRAGRHRHRGPDRHSPTRRPGPGGVDPADRPRHVHLPRLRDHRSGGSAAGGGRAQTSRPPGCAEHLAGSGRRRGAGRGGVRAGADVSGSARGRRSRGAPQRPRVPADLAVRAAGHAGDAGRGGLPAGRPGHQATLRGGFGIGGRELPARVVLVYGFDQGIGASALSTSSLRPQPRPPSSGGPGRPSPATAWACDRTRP